jgi:hypothetical protein
MHLQNRVLGVDLYCPWSDILAMATVSSYLTESSAIHLLLQITNLVRCYIVTTSLRSLGTNTVHTARWFAGLT